MKKILIVFLTTISTSCFGQKNTQSGRVYQINNSGSNVARDQYNYYYIGSRAVNLAGNFVDDGDGNKYAVFKFDNLLWLGANLNTLLSKNECSCFDDKYKNCLRNGRLYSYWGAINACRKLGVGWRLPTYLEFEKLALSHKGGYVHYKIFGKNEEFGNPEQGYINLYEGGITGFNNILSGKQSLGIYSGLGICSGFWSTGRPCHGYFKASQTGFLTYSDHDYIDETCVDTTWRLSCRCVKEINK